MHTTENPAQTVGEYCQHLGLALLWLRWNGMRGTELQAAKIMRKLDAATLRRMLAERGVAEVSR